MPLSTPETSSEAANEDNERTIHTHTERERGDRKDLREETIKNKTEEGKSRYGKWETVENLLIRNVLYLRTTQ